jgi:hypothetical protein
MAKKKQRDKEKDFKQAKYYFMTFRFGGSLICAYFIYYSIVEIIYNYENNQTGGVFMFLAMLLFFLYLTITLFMQGLKVLKAKRVSELP